MAEDKAQPFPRNPEGLRQAGETLYGQRWRADLARDLGVSTRSVRRWACGAEPIGPRHWARLACLLRERAAQSTTLAHHIEQSG